MRFLDLTPDEQAQHLADHNADLQEYIDHLWRIVTRTVQDNDGLDTRIKYEQARDALEAIYGKAPND
jgi:hypothetical protein